MTSTVQAREMTLVQGALKKVLKDRFRADRVSETTDLVGEGVLDSLDAISFIFELERDSGVEFPQTDLAEQGYYRMPRLLAFLGGH